MMVLKIVIFFFVLVFLCIPKNLMAISCQPEFFKEKTYQRSLQKGVQDCQKGEVKLGMLSFRIAELSSLTPSEWAQAKFFSLLCLSEFGLTKSFHSELIELDQLQINPEFRLKVNLLKAISGYEGIQFLTPSDENRIHLWEKSKNLEEMHSYFLMNLEFSKKIVQAVEHSGVQLENPYYSPLLLGLSSAVIPGLGQAIQGNWGSAGTAFVLNALALGTSIEFYNRGYFFATGVSILIFSIFYVGNIANVTNQANHYNQSKTLEFQKSLKWFLFPELRLEF